MARIAAAIPCARCARSRGAVVSRCATPQTGAGKWLYRDYVVRALNDDKALDRFITEQLAGDELFDWRSRATFTAEEKDLLVATGFLRTAADETLQNELNTADIRHAVLAKTMETVATSLLGLTVGCARCHNQETSPKFVYAEYVQRVH